MTALHERYYVTDDVSSVSYCQQRLTIHLTDSQSSQIRIKRTVSLQAFQISILIYLFVLSLVFFLCR